MYIIGTSQSLNSHCVIGIGIFCTLSCTGYYIYIYIIMYIILYIICT